MKKGDSRSVSAHTHRGPGGWLPGGCRENARFPGRVTHSSLPPLSRARCVVASVSEPCSLRTEVYLCQPGWLLSEAENPLPRPALRFQLITQPPSGAVWLPSPSRAIQAPSRLPFLYLLCLRPPHSVETEGWLSCHGNPLPPPFSLFLHNLSTF